MMEVQLVSYHKKGQQSGVALISVLLVFALVAIIGSQIASRNYRDIRKTANIINSKQAYHFALGGEQFARQILFRDYDESERNNVDSLTDNWANIDQVFDIDNGSMTIEVSDLQGRFNINNLINEGNKINQSALADFKRLQTELKLSNDYSVALIDWLDSDTNPSESGAEDEEYAENNYKAANQAMADISELRLIHQMTIQDYEKLKPHVVALPWLIGDKESRATKYNLNTLDAKLLAALFPELDDGAAARVVQQQRQGGKDTLTQWSRGSGITSLNAKKNQLSVDSEFFELRIVVNYQQRLSVIQSQLFRDASDGKITVIKRQQHIE